MDWFQTRVRRLALKQIALAVAIVAGLAALAANEARYLRNYFAGPVAMTATDLAAITSPAALERYWVAVKPDEVVDTGIDHKETTRRRRGGTSTSVVGHYYALRFGDRLVITEAESDVTPTGTVRASIEPLAVNLIAPSASPEFRARFLPFMLQAKPFEESAQWGFLIGGVLMAGALYFGLKGGRLLTNPAGHPALTALTARPGFSLADEGAAVAADVAAKSIARGKGQLLSTRFYAKTGGLSFVAKPLDDLLWAYHEVTKRKIYWIIPAGSSHAIALGFRDELVSMPIRKAQVEPALALIGLSAPWALLGHSPEIAAAYASQRQDLAGFVDERKAELSASGGIART